MSSFRYANRSFPFAMAVAVVATSYLSTAPAWANGDCSSGSCSCNGNRPGNGYRTFDTEGRQNGQPQLPSRLAPTVGPPNRGGQTFRVSVVPLTEGDRAGIARQRICPVTRAKLGSMGPPTKLVAGGRSLYLCCRGCVDKVRQHPAKFFTKSASLRKRYEPRSAAFLVTAKSTLADQAAIQAQGTCPVTKASLGSMGTPIKIARGGQSLFVCCQGCVAKVKSDPDHYFAQIARKRTGN